MVEMLAKTILVLFHLTLSSSSIGVLRSEKEKSNQPLVKYGYPDGDVTHGVGYGHHLHPFYYRGKLSKYYDCALEDEWTPFSVDEQNNHDQQQRQQPTKKQHKSSPPKKYDNANGKKKMARHRNVVNRNDGDDVISLERDHAKLIREINGMSETRPLFAKYRILVPDEGATTVDGFNSEPNSYEVYEHSSDTLADIMMTQHHRQVHTPPPFHGYKKIKVIAVKPPSMVKFKYAVPPKVLARPQAFVPANPTENKERGSSLRKGKHMVHPRPRLTILEQFLLLFPRLI